MAYIGFNAGSGAGMSDYDRQRRLQDALMMQIMGQDKPGLQSGWSVGLNTLAAALMGKGMSQADAAEQARLQQQGQDTSNALLNVGGQPTQSDALTAAMAQQQYLGGPEKAITLADALYRMQNPEPAAPLSLPQGGKLVDPKTYETLAENPKPVAETKPTPEPEFVRTARALGLSDDEAKALWMRKNAPKGMSIRTNPDGTFEFTQGDNGFSEAGSTAQAKEMGKRLGEKAAPESDDVAKISNAIALLDQAIELNDTAFGGYEGSVAEFVGRLTNDRALTARQMESRDATSRQKQIFANLTAEMVKPTVGGSQISNADIQFVKQAVSAEGNESSAERLAKLTQLKEIAGRKRAIAEMEKNNALQGKPTTPDEIKALYRKMGIDYDTGAKLAGDTTIQQADTAQNAEKIREAYRQGKLSRDDALRFLREMGID